MAAVLSRQSYPIIMNQSVNQLVSQSINQSISCQCASLVSVARLLRFLDMTYLIQYSCHMSVCFLLLNFIVFFLYRPQFGRFPRDYPSF
jgi:hypothetical protein